MINQSIGGSGGGGGKLVVVVAEQEEEDEGEEGPFAIFLSSLLFLCCFPL